MPGPDQPPDPSRPRRPLGERRIALAASGLLPALLLLPFLTKAFHVDDTVFLWIARQVRAHPLDPFGFVANWYGRPAPMSEIIHNPPGVSFYLAVVTSLLGEQEALVHAAFLPIAVAAGIGVFVLGEALGMRPGWAALAAALCASSPVFLVACSGVMGDPLMTALGIWSLALWARGIERRRPVLLALSALCAGLSALSKYSGLATIPLLLVYTVARQRRLDRRCAWLLIPGLLLAAYQGWIYHRYQVSFLAGAFSYSLTTQSGTGVSVASNLLVGLSFVGGCTIAALCCAPLLWARRERWIGVGLALVLTIAIPVAVPVDHPLWQAESIRWDMLAQWVLFALGGISVFALAIAGVRRHRDPASILLLCWISGTFVFSIMVNWTINGRSILPIAPAAALLLARRLEERQAARPGRALLLMPLVAAAAIALGVAAADQAWASSAREAARRLTGPPRTGRGRQWFAGHWGFQYYMERAGAKPIDYGDPRLAAGDELVIPRNNTNSRRIADPRLRLAEVLRLPGGSFACTMSVPAGAGFYTQQWGPLPFSLAPRPPEEYGIFRVGAPAPVPP